MGRGILWRTVVVFSMAISLLVAWGTSGGFAEAPCALIYNGPASAEGAPEAMASIAERVGLPVTYVSDVSELPRLIGRAAVFIIGGTEDDMNPLIEAFTPEVTAALQDYLKKGGRYLGICGGGFMASLGWDENGRRVRTLGIIPAEVEDFDSDARPRALSIRWLGKTRSLYFQAGPAFLPVQSAEAVRVLATYADGRVAALMCSYGKGRVAVSGPHPEAPESWGDELTNGQEWTPSTELAVSLLRELLSDGPIRP